ncbi:hypothetical protein [Krasilnikovia sp. MM14-A1259]|uniref:hypothetical protein n=1 Tax=Krasilnikovia sp. MM14-A1259 TaxID=3373539 RepID=UPI0038146E64
MKFPDVVTVLRPAGADEYGNPGSGWTSPAQLNGVGFLTGDTVYMPPSADVQRGDRLRVTGRDYDVIGEPDLVRSPSRPVMLLVKVARRLP